VRAIVKGKNVEVPERVREYANRKLARIERMLDDRSDATVEIWTEQHRSAQDSHIVEITLVIDGQTLRSRAAGPSYQAGIDTVIDKIERRAKDHKEKPRVRARPAEEKQILSRIADGTAEQGRERSVVKTKRFAIEPMFEEDAIARMEELGHAFFLFVNAENERFNVLYVRRDGDFGIIEPVVGGEYTKGKSKDKASTRARAAV
jgi:putative sigma-54 modulation protein